MRRVALILVCWFCSAVMAWGEGSPTKASVIGLLTPATAQSYQQVGPGHPGPQLLRDQLARRGLIDGKNVRLDVRLAEGKLERLPGLAEELVRDGVNVIL